MMIRVVACETQPTTAEGLRALLASTEDLQLAAFTTSLRRSIEVARDLSTCILLLDKAFGAQTLLAAINELRVTNASAIPVVWGVSMSEAEAVKYLRAGARGVLSKSAELDSVLACLRSVSAGLPWTEAVTPEAGSSSRAARTRLTQREREVLELVGQGMKNREVAGELGIRPGTVKVHLKHIFEKTGVPDRHALVLAGLTRAAAAG